ncbi:MAG: hypothetical protein INQ03_12220 [Candidatus Heimdallarchaeota archaeon]|nr:hypothetical protein [Candidatus Heimdallarchaeota archaeon]
MSIRERDGINSGTTIVNQYNSGSIVGDRQEIEHRRYNTQSINGFAKILNSEGLGAVLHYQRSTDIPSRVVVNQDEVTSISLRDVKQSLLKVSPINQVNIQKFGSDPVKTKYLSELFNYQFNHHEELDKQVSRYNDARRVDILSEFSYKKMKNPFAMLTILKYLTVTTGKQVSLGLKFEPSRGKALYVPFMIEYGNGRADGIFFIDQKRPLAVKDIMGIEKVVKKTNLNGAKIIANQIGLPAKKFINRLNEELGEEDAFEMIQYDSMLKEIGINGMAS